MWAHIKSCCTVQNHSCLSVTHTHHNVAISMHLHNPFWSDTTEILLGHVVICKTISCVQKRTFEKLLPHSNEPSALSFGFRSDPLHVFWEWLMNSLNLSKGRSGDVWGSSPRSLKKKSFKDLERFSRFIKKISKQYKIRMNADDLASFHTCACQRSMTKQKIWAFHRYCFKFFGEKTEMFWSQFYTELKSFLRKCSVNL